MHYTPLKVIINICINLEYAHFEMELKLAEI